MLLFARRLTKHLLWTLQICRRGSWRKPTPVISGVPPAQSMQETFPFLFRKAVLAEACPGRVGRLLSCPLIATFESCSGTSTLLILTSCVFSLTGEFALKPRATVLSWSTVHTGSSTKSCEQGGKSPLGCLWIGPQGLQVGWIICTFTKSSIETSSHQSESLAT